MDLLATMLLASIKLILRIRSFFWQIEWIEERFAEKSRMAESPLDISLREKRRAFYWTATFVIFLLIVASVGWLVWASF